MTQDTKPQCPIIALFGEPDHSPLCDDDFDGANFFEKMHILFEKQPGPNHNGQYGLGR